MITDNESVKKKVFQCHLSAIALSLRQIYTIFNYDFKKIINNTACFPCQNMENVIEIHILTFSQSPI